MSVIKIAAGLIAVSLAGFAGATVAVAHGGDPDLIHACVKPSGLLRIVDADATCHPSEQPLDWNISGPPGADGVSGWEIVQSGEFTLEPNSSVELFAECPAGKRPIGGGFSKAPSTPDSPPGMEIVSSFPAFFEFEGNLNSGWVVHALNRGSANALVQAWAVCAFVTE
jgi:hypothetical protein